MQSDKKLGAASIAILLAVGCGSAQTAPTPQRCGDVVGAWSSPVDGLRGRIITSGSVDDRSSLSVAVELENVSAEPLAVHWDGRPTLGYVTFALDDEAGAEVPAPPWALGGNEAVGSLREVITPSSTVRHELREVFGEFAGGRILRVGAFWAREMPSDGARRSLRARVAGRAPQPDDQTMLVDAHGEETFAEGEGSPGRAWNGPLDLPSVCID